MGLGMLPRRFMLAQACCLAAAACLRMALLGVLAGDASAGSGTGASALLFFMETGTLVALSAGGSCALSPWRSVAFRGCACLAVVLTLTAFMVPLPGQWALHGTAFLGAMCFAWVMPALARGTYDFVDRDAVPRLTRIVVSVDALVQMLGPAIVGHVMAHAGGEPVFLALAAAMLVASLSIFSLRAGGRGTSPTIEPLIGAERAVTWHPTLRVLVGVSVVEHLLIAAFFASFTESAIGAGWTPAELGLAISIVYAGTLAAMVLPVPADRRSRWWLFLTVAGAVPALLRLAFLWVEPSQHALNFALLAAVGVAIGVEQLLFGVIRFDLVPREQAVSLQRQLMFGAALAAAAGTGLSALGTSAGGAKLGLMLSIAIGAAALLAAFVWLRSRPSIR